MHRRKWSLTLNGLEGEPGENEVRTLATVKSFTKDKLTRGELTFNICMSQIVTVKGCRCNS